jgi:hypothetical protein
MPLALNTPRIPWLLKSLDDSWMLKLPCKYPKKKKKSLEGALLFTSQRFKAQVYRSECAE